MQLEDQEANEDDENEEANEDDEHEEVNESEEVDLTGPYAREEKHKKSRKDGLPAPSPRLPSLLYGGA